MIDLMNLTENKVSVNLDGYPVVFGGETGDGKTDSMNRYLRSVAPEGKVPLFIELEDRYKAIPNLMAQRCYSIPDILSVVNQLKNPKIRERFSGVVIDTIDKFEDMANNYIASNKEVEITEDIGFGKGNRYLKSKVDILNEIRNLGLPVHFTVQLYKKVDIIKQTTTYQTKLKDVTKAQMFHDAFLVGVVKLDKKVKDPLNSDRLISFSKDSEYLDLKDTFGLPKEMHVADIKSNIEKLFSKKYNENQLSTDSVLEEVKEDESFESIIQKGKMLGSALVENGHMDEAMNVLKTVIGVEHDEVTPKMLDSLVESQIDIAKVVVMKLQDNCDKFGIKS